MGTELITIEIRKYLEANSKKHTNIKICETQLKIQSEKSHQKGRLKINELSIKLRIYRKNTHKKMEEKINSRN